jgi:hypothetical protein
MAMGFQNSLMAKTGQINQTVGQLALPLHGLIRLKWGVSHLPRKVMVVAVWECRYLGCQSICLQCIRPVRLVPGGLALVRQLK